MTRLRPARAKDAAAVAALTRAAYQKWVAVIGREPRPMQVDYADALARHRFDVLERAGEIVAVLETVADGDHLLIENIAVAPEQQRQGLGAALLQEAQRLAVRSGLRGLRLYTNARFVENVGFYERRGFRFDRTAPLNDGVAV